MELYRRGWRASGIINPLKPQVMKRIILISFSVINQILMSTLSVAQPLATGSIVGLIRDSDSEMALPFANLVLEKTDKTVSGTAADFSGSFEFQNLEYGTYDLSISFLGYEVEVIRGIVVSELKPYYIEAYLCSQSVPLQEVVIEAKSIPILEKDCCTRCTFYCGGSRHCCVHRKDGLEDDTTFEVEPTLLPEPTLLLYPNPASSMVTVEILEHPEDKVDFNVFDKTGRLVLALSSKAAEGFKIPIDHLPNGVYFMNAVMLNHVLTERFIVAK